MIWEKVVRKHALKSNTKMVNASSISNVVTDIVNNKMGDLSVAGHSVVFGRDYAIVTSDEISKVLAIHWNYYVFVRTRAGEWKIISD